MSSGEWATAVSRKDALSICSNIETCSELQRVGGVTASLMSIEHETRGHYVILLNAKTTGVGIQALSAHIVNCSHIAGSYIQTEHSWSRETARFLIPKYSKGWRLKFCFKTYARVVAIIILCFLLVVL